MKKYLGFLLVLSLVSVQASASPTCSQTYNTVIRDFVKDIRSTQDTTLKISSFSGAAIGGAGTAGIWGGKALARMGAGVIGAAAGFVIGGLLGYMLMPGPYQYDQYKSEMNVQDILNSVEAKKDSIGMRTYFVHLNTDYKLNLDYPTYVKMLTAINENGSICKNFTAKSIYELGDLQRMDALMIEMNQSLTKN